MSTPIPFQNKALCTNCTGHFNMVTRKHHCRNCGQTFCNTCSSKRSRITRLGFVNPVRVCTPCFIQLKPKHRSSSILSPVDGVFPYDVELQDDDISSMSSGACSGAEKYGFKVAPQSSRQTSSSYSEREFGHTGGGFFNFKNDSKPHEMTRSLSWTSSPQVQQRRKSAPSVSFSSVADSGISLPISESDSLKSYSNYGSMLTTIKSSDGHVSDTTFDQTDIETLRQWKFTGENVNALLSMSKEFAYLLHPSVPEVKRRFLSNISTRLEAQWQVSLLLLSPDKKATLPPWLQDDCCMDCQNCQASFSFFKRKHHCRVCGGIYCASCAGKYFDLPKYNIWQGRVCDSCYWLLNIAKYS